MSNFKFMVLGLDPIGAGIVFDNDGGVGGGEGGEGDNGQSAGEGAGSENAGTGDGSGDNGAAEPSLSWRDSITDEALAPIAARFNSPADVVKAVSDLRKQVSTSIRVPGEDANPEDVAKFRKALGVPDSPDGYKFKVPEGREATEADKAFQGKLSTMFHESGIPASAASKLNDFWNEMTVQAEEAQAAADAKYVAESKAALQTKWGADMERNQNLAGRAARYLFGEQFEAATQIEMGDGRMLLDHPVILEALAKAGIEMDEDGFERMDPASVEGINSEIKSLQEQQHLAHASGNNTKATELDAKIQALYAKLYKS